MESFPIKQGAYLLREKRPSQAVVGHKKYFVGVLSLSATSNVDISNSIIWGNLATNGAQIYQKSGSDITISFFDLQSGDATMVYNDGSSSLTANTVNIDADPLLDENLYLQSGSLCIDAGDPSSTLLDDIDGDVRPIGLGIDIGADEFLGRAPIADAGPVQAIGDSVTLDVGGSSDPDNDPLTYAWQLVHRLDSAHDQSASGLAPTLTDIYPGSTMCS